jgi:hypothetical protein
MRTPLDKGSRGRRPQEKIFERDINSNIATADTNWAKLTGSQSQKR